jgi:hypothetical protein
VQREGRLVKLAVAAGPALLVGSLVTACGAGVQPGPAGVAQRVAAAGARLGSGARAQSEPSPGTSPAASYRWLVRTAGAPPSITEENRAAGTSAWRLPGPASLLGGRAQGAIAGYVAQQAIAPGETERVYVSAAGARTVTVGVYRMGWYGGRGGRLVLKSGRLAAIRQPPCVHRFSTGLTECRWRATLSFAIPPALPSGVYIAKLQASSGAQSDCLFVVRPARAARLLVELPTATWEAYNAWGGDSLYPGGHDRVGVSGSSQGVEVSYDRPYESETGAGQFFLREVAMVRFLERYGYPVAYTTIDSIDRDPAQVRGARALMDVGHSEYWSAADALAFRQARDRGTSLIFISSDTMAWRVRFARASSASSQAGQAGHRIIAYKQWAAADPDRVAPSGPFPLGGAPLVGSAYNGCIAPRVPGPGPATYRYYAWTPGPALRPRWLFAGTRLTAAASVPGIVGYELDQRSLATPPGTLLIGAGAGVPCMPGTELSPVHGTVAETTLYTAPSGALVFATGTLGWEYALEPVPEASPEAPPAPDPRIVTMTRNLLARALAR